MWLVEWALRAGEGKDRQNKHPLLKVMVEGPARGLPVPTHPFSFILIESLLLSWTYS